MAQTKHTNPDIAPRPLTSEQEAQVGGGVLINHGPLTAGAGVGAPAPSREMSDGARRWLNWKGAGIWESLVGAITGRKPEF